MCETTGTSLVRTLHIKTAARDAGRVEKKEITKHKGKKKHPMHTNEEQIKFGENETDFIRGPTTT